MSLQVWLPLNGNLDNQGLNILPATPSYTNMTFAQSGKIGKYHGQGKACWHLSEDILDNEWSVALWYYNSSSTSMDWSSTGNSILFCKNSADMPNAQIYLSIFQKNKLNICANDGSNATALQYQHSFVKDKWYHFATTYDGTNLKLYMNGTLVASKVTTAAKKTGCMNICIDGRATNAAGTIVDYGSNGLYNDVRLYNHAISEREVKMLSQALVLHYPLTGGGRSGDNLAKNSMVLSPTASKSTLNISSRGTATRQLRSDGFYESCCNGEWQGLSIYANMLNLEAGDTLTFSFYTYVSSSQHNISFYPMMFNSSGTRDTTTKLYMRWDDGHSATANALNYGWISSTTPQRHYVTFTWNNAVKSIIDNGGYIELSIQAHGGGWSDGSNICFFRPKLERGNIPTPWMPNSADAVYTAMGYNDSKEYDVSGYNNHGTKLSTITYDSDTARYNVSSRFNGTDAGILIENLQLSNIINTAVTYSFWIKSNDNNGRSVYFGSWSGTSWSVEKTTGNTLRLYWNASPDEVCTGATISDGVWQHICITKQGTNDIKVYINGVQKWKSTATHNNLTFPTTYRIGRDTRSGDGTPYKGLMSDFRIYATALSAEDVKELYNTAASLSNNGTLFAYEYVEV